MTDAESIGRRRRADALRNRSAIVEAANRELIEGANLTMQAVAAAAGVSRSTLHRHFPTRTDLDRAVREECLETARRAIEAAGAEQRPALSVSRRLVGALVGVGAERCLEAVGALPLGDEGEKTAAGMTPILARVAQVAEIAPSPSHDWLRKAGGHLLAACLELGVRERGNPTEAAEALFRSLTDPLDQGVVVLDPGGSVLCINPRAARLLSPGEPVEAGDRLAEPRVDVLYEDGSACPGDKYPLGAAVRSGEPQAAVRGHRSLTGEVSWIAVEAHPLRSIGGGPVYSIIGTLYDVTTEKRWDLERLRPPGQLAPVGPVPFDIARVLNEIPPHLFPEQLTSEARRLTGTPVALYVLDIDGTHLLRLAGADEFPARIDAPLALGPELAPDGVPDLKVRLESELPGVAIAPMWLRGRAIGILLTVRGSEEALFELARYGAAAMELAGGYTDVFDSARRRKETTPAAELQQSLVPPRIARMGGGELAGGVLPSYKVGGDWFDYVENRDGAWIAVADAVGKGSAAAALGGIGLAALRAARRSGQSLEAAAQTMHEAINEVGNPEFFLTAIVARWHAVYSTFSWVNGGHPPPLVLRANDTIEQLMTEPQLPLGLLGRERRFTRNQRRVEEGERLILHSDGITARRTPDGLFGLDGIERAVRGAQGRTPAAIARAIQEAVVSAAEDPLQDDAVVVVLAPRTAPGRT